MNREKEYRRVVRLFAEVLAAPKGPQLHHQRWIDCDWLAMKLFFHAASAYHLAQGTQLKSLVGEAACFVDHASVKVLARAALEAYLVFCYVFVQPESPDDLEFRYLAWKLGGLAMREVFPAQLEESRRQIVEEKRLNEELRDRIRQTRRFQNLSNGQKRAVLEKRKWRFEGWVPIARAAGFGEQYSRLLYGFLSSYAHSDSLSILQLGEAKARDDQVALAWDALGFILAIVSKMVVTYSELFPQAKQAFARHGEAAGLAKAYVAALERLR